MGRAKGLYRQHSLEYVQAEDTAKALKLGIWSGRFDEPSKWRKGERGAAKTSATSGAPDAAPDRNEPKLRPTQRQTKADPQLVARSCCKYCSKGKLCGKQLRLGEQDVTERTRVRLLSPTAVV